MSEFIPASHIRKVFACSPSQLRKWANDGTIRHVRFPTGKRLYSRVDIEQLLNGADQTRTTVLYARVSSAKQKADLERQQHTLQTTYPTSQLYSDVGSGLNWKRPSFRSLLDAVLQRNIATVVVTHRDRLARFGFELLEHIFNKHGTSIVVLSSDNTGHEGSGAEELAEDLLAVTTVFVARNNGLRAAQNRRNRRSAQAQTPPEASTGDHSTTVDGSGEMDVQRGSEAH